MLPPKFTVYDVKYAAGSAVYERALALYQSGKVEKPAEQARGYRAVVQGTHPYHVSLSRQRLDQCDCTCYLGQNGTLCKHVLALALAVLHESGNSSEQQPQQPASLEEIKPRVNAGMRKLRPYNGPSHLWFSYQRALATGAGMISSAVSGLPPSADHARYLWNLVERIDKKLASTVDDSDGVAGECVMSIIDQLAAYAREQPELAGVIRPFCSRKTEFDFGRELQARLGPQVS